VRWLAYRAVARQRAHLLITSADCIEDAVTLQMQKPLI
jgi:hypothetical protein